MNHGEEYITIKEFQRQFPGILKTLDKTRYLITRYGEVVGVLSATGGTDRTPGAGVGVQQDGEVGQDPFDIESTEDDKGLPG
jgi:hypothetical protein